MATEEVVVVETPRIVTWLALSVACIACGKSAKDHCAQVHQATCPADHPMVNPYFAYDYRSPGSDKTDCEKSLDGPCGSELAQYVDCYIKDPICCAQKDNGYLDCVGGQSCNQDAYLACVSMQH